MYYYHIIICILICFLQTNCINSKKLNAFTWAIAREKIDISYSRRGTIKKASKKNFVLEAEEKSFIEANNIFIHNRAQKKGATVPHVILLSSDNSAIHFLSTEIITNRLSAHAHQGSIHSDNSTIEAEHIYLKAEGRSAFLSGRELAVSSPKNSNGHCVIEAKDHGIIYLQAADFRSFNGTIVIKGDETTTKNIILDGALFDHQVKGLPAHYLLLETTPGTYTVTRN